MEENDQIPTFTDVVNQEPKRPTGLTIWCILSFANAVYQFFVGLMTYFSYNVIKNMFSDEEYLDMMEKYGMGEEQMEKATGAILAVGRSYYMYTALLYVASFIGVLYMWKQMKKGFHIYSIAQILILIVYVLMFCNATGESPWGSVILTALWIGIYYLYYKRNMK